MISMDPTKDTIKFLRAASVDALRDHGIGAVLGLLLLLAIPAWFRNFLALAGLLLFLSNVFGSIITIQKPRRMKVNGAGKAVIITGCDSGFGQMLAMRLDDCRFQVFAACLFPDGDGARKLKKCTSSRLHILGMDVTKDDDISKAVDYVENNLGTNELWAVVCNAGLNDGAEIFWTGMDVFEKVIDVNLHGVIRVTKAFLPFVTKSKGRVVAVSSAAGRYCFPGLGAYCVSKHGIIAFCDTLRTEMYKFGVQVVTIEPWMYRTGLVDGDMVKGYLKRTWDKAPENLKSFFPPGYIDQFIPKAINLFTDSISDDPNEVVHCLEEAVVAKHPRFSYGPGSLKSRLITWFIRNLPKPIYDFILISPFLQN